MSTVEERVAEMCARCTDIEKVDGTRWQALMWCSEIGDYVVGYGTSAWAAVEAAHALHASASA